MSGRLQILFLADRDSRKELPNPSTSDMIQLQRMDLEKYPNPKRRLPRAWARPRDKKASRQGVTFRCLSTGSQTPRPRSFRKARIAKLNGSHSLRCNLRRRKATQGTAQALRRCLPHRLLRGSSSSFRSQARRKTAIAKPQKAAVDERIEDLLIERHRNSFAGGPLAQIATQQTLSTAVASDFVQPPLLRTPPTSPKPDVHPVHDINRRRQPRAASYRALVPSIHISISNRVDTTEMPP